MIEELNNITIALAKECEDINNEINDINDILAQWKEATKDACRYHALYVCSSQVLPDKNDYYLENNYYLETNCNVIVYCLREKNSAIKEVYAWEEKLSLKELKQFKQNIITTIEDFKSQTIEGFYSL